MSLPPNPSCNFSTVHLWGIASVRCRWHSSVAKSLSLISDRTFAGQSFSLQAYTEHNCRYALITHCCRDISERIFAGTWRICWLFSSSVSFKNCVTPAYSHCYVSVRQSRKYLLLPLAHQKISFILLCRVRTVFVSLPRVEIWYYGYLWEKIIFLLLSYEDAHNYRLQISSFSMTWWPCKTLCVCYSKISNFIFCLTLNCWIEIRKMLYSY